MSVCLSRAVPLKILTLVCFFVFGGDTRSAEAETFRIYVDADFSTNSAVADAVMLGLEASFASGSEVALELVPADHRSSPKRSKRNMQQFLADPDGLAVFGGMQSPPYLTYGDFINGAGVPLLLPWSAGGPITRMAEGDANHMFRLSVDDTKAGPFLVRAARAGGCQRLALLLIDTGWGRANRKTMLAAMRDIGVDPVAVEMVDNQLGPAAARSIARDTVDVQADCVLGVLSAKSGAHLMNALDEIDADVAVFSHWGILSQSFVAEVPAPVRDRLSLSVLQSCGLQAEQQGSPMLSSALSHVGLSRLNELRAPAGFVHAFDLGLLMQAALRQAAETPEWGQGITARRSALRTALENLEQPVQGILKTYDKPFSSYAADNFDAHEALGLDDLCLAAFDEQGLLKALSYEMVEG